MRDIGERLQARARELGMSDTEVARRLGLAQGRYSNYVNGSREPDLATFARICRELSLTPNELLGFDTGEDGASSGMRARLEKLLTTFEDEELELALGLLNVIASYRRASDTLLTTARTTVKTTGIGHEVRKRTRTLSRVKPQD